MSLISLQEVSLSLGGLPLLDRVNMQLEAGERVCLVGRNGEGKSTLLKLLAGGIAPDSGRIKRQPGLKVGMLAQEVEAGLTGTVRVVVAGGLGEFEEMRRPHRRISAGLAAGADDGPILPQELAAAQHDPDGAGGWQVRHRVEAVLTRLKLDGNQQFAQLSGGLKRQVLLARAMVCEPDLLLLDEPTNHLDIEAITWLEQFLRTLDSTILFITHDRQLARQVATRILDLDRGRLTSWPGDYGLYLRRKAEYLATEETQQAKFDKKLSEEESWIRQGVKARRTRNQGRVRALMVLRAERKGRRELPGMARLQLPEAELSGRLVVQAKNISWRYGRLDLIRDLSTTILRGDKVGIIGANGCGKTTLLQVLLGERLPQQGTIRQGSNLAVAYYDQLRGQLDEAKSVAENVADGQEFLTCNGRNRHIIGYLKDFLFTPERARSPVSVLSGGERNRLLLARLFSRPANVLILDEPTNDLDVETLELLEELLLDFPGTVLLVSHDRAFLNNVVTSTLVFEGGGRVQEYAGGYDDWLLQRKGEVAPAPTSPALKKQKPRPARAGTRKLTFNERRELSELPARIEELEAQQRELYASLADPAFYQQGGSQTAALKARLAELEKELEEAFVRWEELEEINDKEAPRNRVTLP